MKIDSKPTRQSVNIDVFGQIGRTSIKSWIVKEIRSIVIDGTLLPGDQLPNELELSEKLRVSRGALRDALQELEKTGFIIRRHGVGTFISENPLKSNNLNVNWGITKVIQSLGDTPGTISISISTRNCTKKEAGLLNIPIGAPVVLLERIRTANGIRIAFTIDEIPLSLLTINNSSISIEEMKKFFKKNQSLLSFFREIIQIELHHAIASLQPLSASAKIGSLTLAQKLNVAEDFNILAIEQVEYMANGIPAIYVREYHLSNYLSFNVYRSY